MLIFPGVHNVVVFSLCVNPGTFLEAISKHNRFCMFCSTCLEWQKSPPKYNTTPAGLEGLEVQFLQGWRNSYPDTPCIT